MNESAGVVPIEVALHAGELRGNQYVVVILSLTGGSCSCKEKENIDCLHKMRSLIQLSHCIIMKSTNVQTLGAI